MNDATPIMVSQHSSTTVITLNRPSQRNAITLAMWRMLSDIIKDASQSDSCRALVITGAGGHFSAGADIKEFAIVRNSAERSEEYELAVDACCDSFMMLGKPSIAAIQGACFGGACHLAMSCDFRFAEMDASFAIPSAKLCIVYGVRASLKLLSLVGLTNAKRLLFLGEPLSATAAIAMGLVDEVATNSLDAALGLAQRMAVNAPLAIAGSKMILNGLAMGNGALETHQATEAIQLAASSEDYIEGRLSFEEKRAPRFKGR